MGRVANAACIKPGGYDGVPVLPRRDPLHQFKSAARQSSTKARTVHWGKLPVDNSWKLGNELTIHAYLSKDSQSEELAMELHHSSRMQPVVADGVGSVVHSLVMHLAMQLWFDDGLSPDDTYFIGTFVFYFLDAARMLQARTKYRCVVDVHTFLAPQSFDLWVCVAIQAAITVACRPGFLPAWCRRNEQERFCETFFGGVKAAFASGICSVAGYDRTVTENTST